MGFCNKIKCLIVPLLIIDLLPNLVACTTLEEIGINISIDEQNCVQSSNNAITTFTPTAYFTFQLSNILEGDIFNILINEQEKDDKKGSFINISAGSQNIALQNDQKDVTVPFELLSDELRDEIFEVSFSVVCTITRLDNIIYKTTIKDLYFENATPTTDDIFSYQQNNDGKKVLVGWNQEPWAQEQLSKCNILLIPNDVTEISELAFVTDFKTTIPENIKYVYFDSGFGHHRNLSKLTKIGPRSFWNSEDVIYKNITFPDSLCEIGMQAFHQCNKFCGVLTFGPNMQTIGTGAFQINGGGITSLIFNSRCSLQQAAFLNCCKNVQTIDVSAYGSELPSDWDTLWLFESLTSSTPENPRYVYISNISDQQKWRDFLSEYNENFDTWIYTTKN